MSIPEGTETITSEGADLKRAVAEAAEQLGIKAGQVDYKFEFPQSHWGT
jgi:hypothetical protein